LLQCIKVARGAGQFKSFGRPAGTQACLACRPPPD
jgi:hypothetical protein